MLWLGGVLCLFIVPPLILFLRKVKAAAEAAGARLKDLAVKTAAAATAPASIEPPCDHGAPGATQLAAAAALGLTRKVCPISMYSNDSSNPDFWHEGTFDGRMLGLLDHGTVWLGESDEETLCAFTRPDAKSPFQGEDFTDRNDHPVLRDEEIARTLTDFSPAVNMVSVLANAVEARFFDWKSATAESVAADARILSKLRTKVESHDADHGRP